MSDERWQDFKKKLYSTLPEYVVSVFDEKGKESDEWKSLEELLGLPKLRELYAKGKKKKTGEAPAAEKAAPA